MEQHHVYRVIEVAGSSPDGIEDAIRSAVDSVGRSMEHLRWFQVSELRGHIDKGKIAHWQVVLKVGLTLDPDLMQA